MGRLAIDLGTCQTVIARADSSGQDVVPVNVSELAGVFQPEGFNGSLIPSVLYLENASQRVCLVGQPALDRVGSNTRDPRFFRTFKRTVVSAVHAFVPVVDGMAVDSAWVLGQYLLALLRRLQAEYTPIDELIITAPVQAFEAYLCLLRQVAIDAGVTRLRVIDEPTAAAWGCGVSRAGAYVLMVDFGGGTLDLALVRFSSDARGVVVASGAESFLNEQGLSEVIVKDGALLGGCDLDQWLVDDFLKRHGLSSVTIGDDRALLLELAERVKVRLSTLYEAEFVYFCAGTLKSFRTRYTRDDFEALLLEHNVFHSIQTLLEKTLRRAAEKGVARDAIDAVVLVGGTTLIPGIQRAVRQNFAAHQVMCDRPFDAVVRGALLVPGQDCLADGLYHAYGVRYWDPRRQLHRYERLFEQGHRFPSDKPVELVLRASKRNQRHMELVIGEIDDGLEGPFEVTIRDQQVSAVRLHGVSGRVVPLNDSEGAKTIAVLDPPGQPGLDRILVRFWVDENRHLRLHVQDLLTGRCLIDDTPVVALR